ncbi:MAG: carbohydrate ABC transporter permease [Actinobacteria bacterium]|nr:carbohydrate ABC transporter permease [Actinomycetota bacterium]
MGVVLVMVAPLIWMILGSLKSEVEFHRWPPTILPEAPTFEAYRQLFGRTDIVTWFRNSVLISITISFLTVGLAAMGGYSLARFRYRFFESFARLILLGYMIPSILLVVPVLLVVRDIGLGGTLPGLFVAYLSFLVPFGLWLLRGYFAGLPEEIEESALIHGATRWQAFRKVVLPNALPGLISTTLFVFHVAWSEYLFASLILFRSSQMTLSPGIATLIGRDAIVSWPMLLAAAVVVTGPVVLVFSVLQGFLIKGWGGGAVKG